ncbi:sugar phosphate nucleotidyltransferase [Haloferacaceae archaeon DSL9]
MPLSTAIVLAAGEGQRLRPLTKHRPKPMLPADNRPILEHVLDTLIDAGIDEIAVVVGYKAARVKSHFGPSYRDVPIQYFHQDKQLGSGHALQQAAPAITDDVVVVNGDQIVATEIVADVIDAHEAGGEAATLSVIDSDKASHYGAVRLDGDHVVEITDHPDSMDSRLLNAGVYAFSPAIVETFDRTPRTDGEITLPNVIATLLDQETRVRGVRTSGMWIDATYPWDLLTVSEHLLAERDDPLDVNETATVHETAVLVPPVAVGKDCQIGPNAVVGPHTALGRNTTIGPNATVEQTVSDGDVRIGAGATMRRCVAGQGTAIGGGATIPNGPSVIAVRDTIHRNVELGAVIADRVTVGGGATLAPGTVIGPNATIAPGVVTDGVIDEDAEVVR